MIRARPRRLIVRRGFRLSAACAAGDFDFDDWMIGSADPQESFTDGENEKARRR